MVVNQHTELIRKIKEKLQTIIDLSPSQLIRESELGSSLSFKKGEDLFLRIIAFSKKIHAIDMSEVSLSVLNGLDNHLKAIIDTFDTIRRFDPNKNPSSDIQKNFIDGLNRYYDQYYQAAMPICTMGLLKLCEGLEEITDNAKKHLGDIKDLSSKAKQAAIKVGLEQHSEVFGEEADKHENLSSRWFKSIIGILAIIAIGSIIFIWCFPKSSADSAYIIQYSVNKVIILTTLFYILSICTKNYKAHKHNHILNKHRKNALDTFEIFSKAAGSDLQTKNAVLLEVTRTIFSHQQTGYLSVDGENDSQNKIIEIFRGTSKDQ